MTALLLAHVYMFLTKKLSEPKVSKLLYILYWVLYLLLNSVVFYENMVRINSTVNVKERQI